MAELGTNLFFVTQLEVPSFVVKKRPKLVRNTTELTLAQRNPTNQVRYPLGCMTETSQQTRFVDPLGSEEWRLPTYHVQSRLSSAFSKFNLHSRNTSRTKGFSRECLGKNYYWDHQKMTILLLIQMHWWIAMIQTSVYLRGCSNTIDFRSKQDGICLVSSCCPHMLELVRVCITLFFNHIYPGPHFPTLLSLRMLVKAIFFGHFQR